MADELHFTVVGIPAPQGSKRHVGNGIMVESSKRVKPWREAVKTVAVAVRPDDMDGLHVFTGPVALTVTFYLPRPKGHYRTGRNAWRLRDSAPKHPAGRPDVDKLVRSTLDAVGEAAIWRDDAQVVSVYARKTYSDVYPPGAYITIAALPATVSEAAA